jgi:hypothetical protein
MHSSGLQRVWFVSDELQSAMAVTPWLLTGSYVFVMYPHVKL